MKNIKGSESMNVLEYFRELEVKEYGKDRKYKRIEVGKFGGVGAHFLRLFFQGFFLADEVQVVNVGLLGQVFTEDARLGRCHVLAQYEGDGEVFLDVCGEISGYEHRKDHHSQQNEHHSGAYA